MKRKQILVLVTVNGVVIFIVLFALARLWDTQWRPKTEGELLVERHQEQRRLEDSLSLVKKRNEHLAELEEERKDKVRDEAYRIASNVRNMLIRYYWNSYGTMIDINGSVFLERKGDDYEEQYSFNITSVEFKVREGKIYASCEKCIHFKKDIQDEYYKHTVTEGETSSVLLSSHSESVLSLFENYKNAAAQNLIGK